MPGKAELAGRMGLTYCPQPSVSSPLCIAAVDGDGLTELGIALPSQRWKGDMVGSVLKLRESGAPETLTGWCT